MKIIKYSIIYMVLFTFSSCQDFLTIEAPKLETASKAVYTNDASAIAAIRGLYHQMIFTGFASGNFSSLTFFGGVSSDELISYYASLNDFYNNSLESSNINVKADLWEAAYKFIYYANSIIDGVHNSADLSNQTTSLLEGEAKFIRAFCHFYLVNLFGDIPLIVITDYRDNSRVERASTEAVYAQIIKDLTDAQNLLPKDYSNYKNERVRATYWAATALLARTFLFKGDWQNAEIHSTSIIQQTDLFGLEQDLSKVFLKNSQEAIWQLMPVKAGSNTNEALYFVPGVVSNVPIFVSLADEFMDAIEPGDGRATNWINNKTIGSETFYYPFKYKVFQPDQPVTEYSMVLRLAEQYLIRAEARANLNKLTESISDVDMIRARADLPLFRDTNPTISKGDLLFAIEQERRIEFLGEWGHRWLDLKRWKKSDSVLSSLKAPNWQSTDVLYPLPQTELDLNSRLNQNLGY